jgi:hypothetical protein
MIKQLLLCLTLLLFAGGLRAQNLSITGVIKDKKGVELPGAGVYLSNYKNATSTDADGKFALRNLKPGSYDVLVQMMGFEPFTRNVVLSDKSVNIDIILKENAIALNEVVIRVDPNREKYLKVFKEFFIGKTPNSEKCKILNPQVLRVDYDGDRKTLTVKSSDFLIIENKALGYRLRYMLQFFEYNYNSRIVYYSGLPNYEDLKGSKSMKKRWFKNRETAYYGSSQHFFRSLYAGTSKEAGYILHKMVSVPNDRRPPDSLINKAMARLSKNRRSVIMIGSPMTDSLSYWANVRDMPKNINILDRSIIKLDTLVTQQYRDLKTMKFKDKLYVIYTKERESVEYTNMAGHSVSRPLDIPNYQISIVNMLESPVHFYENGGIYEPKSLLYEGFWAYEKIADMVPMDYIPLTVN